MHEDSDDLAMARDRDLLSRFHPIELSGQGLTRIAGADRRHEDDCTALYKTIQLGSSTDGAARM